MRSIASGTLVTNQRLRTRAGPMTGPSREMDRQADMQDSLAIKIVAKREGEGREEVTEGRKGEEKMLNLLQKSSRR